jgi:hypothetical protein
MRFLTSGCSFTGQQQYRTGWPVWLEPYGSVTNLGMPGAGNRYIAESVMIELMRNKYDCVLVMWSGLQRLDLVVDSVAAKSLPAGDLCPLDNVHYWPTGDLLGPKKFAEFFKLGNEQTRGYSSLMEMIKLQSFLESKHIPYYFMSYVNYWNSEHQLKNRNFGVYKYQLLSELAEQIDFDRWIFAENNNCLHEISLSMPNGLADDNFHPSADALDTWMTQYVLPVLKQNQIIKE